LDFAAIEVAVIGRKRAGPIGQAAIIPGVFDSRIKRMGML
jgi:hypothetical protein